MKNVHDFLKQTVCQYFFYKSFMKIRLSNDIILQFHNDIINMKRNGNLMFSETVNVPLYKGVLKKCFMNLYNKEYCATHRSVWYFYFVVQDAMDVLHSSYTNTVTSQVYVRRRRTKSSRKRVSSDYWLGIIIKCTLII